MDEFTKTLRRGSGKQRLSMRKGGRRAKEKSDFGPDIINEYPKEPVLSWEKLSYKAIHI